MAKRIRAEQLEKGCRCDVVPPNSAVSTLAIVTAVRDLGEIIEIDVRTKLAFKLEGWIWAQNYHTLRAPRSQLVDVSHLPSESVADNGAADGARKSAKAKA